LQEELGLNMYDYGARGYMPDIGRWGQIDPLAEIYHTDTPFAYVLNNPLSYIDPDGRRLIGVTKDDARKAHDDLNSVFADSKFDKLRGLLTRGEKNNKTTFDKIGDDVLKDALSGLTGDDLALAELVTGAINSDAKHKVEYVEAGTNLSSEGEKAFNSAFSRLYTDNGIPVPTFPTRTGKDIAAVGGQGYNAPTADGSHSFIVNDIGTNHGEGRRELTTFHEIFGHGIASAKKTSDAINNQNAIRAENLVRRVLGIQQQRDGADHAGGKVFGPSALPTVKN
jgi:RHS repeat-associated protein